VDTTVFVTQPILADLRNPFLDNLRVDIDLSVPRNLWLRSREMSVEMGGELIVRYDRAVGDLVMVGDLQALRGSYQVLGRTFEVDGGNVSFLGQPGVNPSLGIQAVSRVRRRGGERLEVRATVAGTLVQPLVTLSTADAGVSQSDLVSYLLFGVPGAELQTSGGLGTGTSTLVGGLVGNQIGSALAEEIPYLDLDYFAISQGDVLGEELGGSNFLNTTQFELGRYLGDDLFVVAVLGDRSGSTTEGILRGVRLELALTEELFVEGFFEDRLLRGSGSLAQTGLPGERIIGFLFFRDWGYGSQ
jgi:autotransporter translocation and assembly factor TamB